MSKKPPSLTLEQALQRMRCGARLVHMHGLLNGPSVWCVVPGGVVADTAAARLREHPAVVAAEDGLFPGHSQTWRMLNFMDRGAP